MHARRLGAASRLVNRSHGKVEPYSEPPLAATWRVVPLSVAGARRAECQDSCACRTFEKGTLVAAVADGAGSVPHGGEGARIASEAAVEWVRARMVDGAGAPPQSCSGLLADTLRAARTAVETRATACGRPPDEFATTLMVIIAQPGLVAAAQVGDGAVVIGDRAGRLTALTAPQHGEYPNETTFIVSPNAIDAAQVVVEPMDIAWLAAFTDGLEQLALQMPGGTPHPNFFLPLFHFLNGTEDEGSAREQLKDFLTSRRIRERTDDDVTLLLAALVR